MVKRRTPTEIGADAPISAIVAELRDLHSCLDEFKTETRRGQAELKRQLGAQISLADQRYGEQSAFHTLIMDAFKIAPRASPDAPAPKARVGVTLPLWPTIGAASALIGVITAIDKLWPLLAKIPKALGGY